MTTAIRRLLVANRGEIALRVIRTARDMGIETAIVASDPDREMPAAKAADLVIPLPGATATETYLDIDKVVAAARVAGADAVHPGYGFLSESAAFARACQAAGVTFVGPSPEAIEAMGSKLAAKSLMAKAGVPILPGGEISQAAELVALGEAHGWPMLIKASAGGGGRGMRIVSGPAESEAAIAAARREAEAAFGDATIFAERYLIGPRHIEVQILGDRSGRVAALVERECSIQRRHQKIVEESPSAAIGPDLRAALLDAARRAGEAIGYEGAGTVEFVVEPDGGFWFLEVNTRLQVEHPVTEMVLGIDLVELQLRAAMGELVADEASAAEPAGHAIEVRLYAEDASNDFLPQTGRLSSFAIGSGVRVDSGVAAGSSISPHYDPMVAKVIAHAHDRQTAAGLLSRALRRSSIDGLITNRALLVGILEDEDFLAGDTTTAYLEEHPAPELAERGSATETRHLRLAAAAAGLDARRRGEADERSRMGAWRNVPTLPQRTKLKDEIGTAEVEIEERRGRSTITVDGAELPGLRVSTASPERVVLHRSGVEQAFELSRSGEAIVVRDQAWCSVVTELPAFSAPVVELAAGSLVAPMPGSVVAVLVTVGQRVAAGQPICVLEAMKMEHQVLSPADGEVAELLIGPGLQVESGQLLAVVESGEG